MLRQDRELFFFTQLSCITNFPAYCIVCVSSCYYNSYAISENYEARRDTRYMFRSIKYDIMTRLVDADHALDNPTVDDY